jgi:hypothetical protein
MEGSAPMRHAGDMHLPGPLRAAVGLAATAAAEARHLPDRAIELPMLAVSSALQASLRAQQRYARLAARGDEVLNRRAPTEEPPPWATFDEPVSLDELRRAAGTQPAGTDSQANRSMFDQLFAVEDPTMPPDGREPVDEIPAADEPPVEPAAQAPAATTPAARTAPTKEAPAKKAAAKKAAAKKAAPARKAAAKSPAAKKAAPARKTATKTAKGSLSKPRHTAPSAFDNAADD